MHQITHHQRRSVFIPITPQTDKVFLVQHLHFWENTVMFFSKFSVSGKCLNSHCGLDAIWPVLCPTLNTDQSSAFSDKTFLFLSVPFPFSQMDCSVSVSAPSRTRSSTRFRSQCWRGCRKSWNSWCCRVTLIFPQIILLYIGFQTWDGYFRMAVCELKPANVCISVIVHTVLQSGEWVLFLFFVSHPEFED